PPSARRRASAGKNREPTERREACGLANSRIARPVTSDSESHGFWLHLPETVFRLLGRAAQVYLAWNCCRNQPLAVLWSAARPLARWPHPLGCWEQKWRRPAESLPAPNTSAGAATTMAWNCGLAEPTPGGLALPPLSSRRNQADLQP